MSLLQSKILYLECKNYESRTKMLEVLQNHYEWLDCTGGQAAFEDDDLQRFGDFATTVASKLNIKLVHILRMPDPGLGLFITDDWLAAGLASGEIQRYQATGH